MGAFLCKMERVPHNLSSIVYTIILVLYNQPAMLPNMTGSLYKTAQH